MALCKTHPELVKQWDHVKNAPLSPDVVTSGSSKKVWWKCEKGHSWCASVAGRAQKSSGCPYCSSKKILAGYNDLQTLDPQLASELDLVKNYPILPSDLFLKSSKKVWWKCEKGHSWRSTVANRSSGCGCPFCAHKKILVGYNDLSTTHPEIAKEFDTEKNSIKVEEIFAGSSKKVWWKCEKGHTWEASPNSRTNMGSRCRACFGSFLRPGVNDIKSKNPELVEQWDYEKNTLSPGQTARGSTKKVWWKCEKGHSWAATPNDRTRADKPTACPACQSKTFVSKAEAELLSYVQTLIPAVGTYKGLQNVFEVDVYVPSRGIAIEFNGLYWHSEDKRTNDYHYNKWLECKRQGVQLIQVWEDEWLEKPSVVKKMLAHKLGVSSDMRVYARKTNAFEVEVSAARVFFEQNHIQGYGAGSIRVGLENSGVLVACGVFKKRSVDTLELVRYATRCNVIGGQGKILKYVKTHYPEIKKIVTFADHCVSDGGLYEALGFTKVGELKPDYKYVINNKRVHKFGYRLKKFEADPNLLFQVGMTEKELAKTNGLLRIYDAGKTKYVLDMTI